MSDGPHKSLPMRPGWKTVAERASKEAFTLHEVCEAINTASAQDYHKDISPDFVASIRDMIGSDSLFSGDSTHALEDLRQFVAGCPMGNALLDHVIFVVSNGKSGDAALQEAISRTFTDWAVRHARQVEEHYRRQSGAEKAQNVRSRMEAAIQNAPFTVLTNRSLDPGAKPARLVKRDSVEDGVPL
jgi:hypothetical protein